MLRSTPIHLFGLQCSLANLMLKYLQETPHRTDPRQKNLAVKLIVVMLLHMLILKSLNLCTKFQAMHPRAVETKIHKCLHVDLK